MSKYKTKVVSGLPLNFESTEPKDFVEVLNKIAEAMGGVSNLGVFADITSVTQSNEMIADVADKYITVSTKRHEMPHNDLLVTTNVAEPYQFELDTLVGKNGSNIPSVLERFLADEGKTKEAAAPTKRNNRPIADDDDDDGTFDESQDNDDNDDDDFGGEGGNDPSSTVEKAIKDATNQVTNELLKEIKGSFKFKL